MSPGFSLLKTMWWQEIRKDATETSTFVKLDFNKNIPEKEWYRHHVKFCYKQLPQATVATRQLPQAATQVNPFLRHE